MSGGIRSWVTLARERGASDLHIEAGSPPVLRVRGELVPVGEPVSGEAATQAARELLDARQWADFLERRSFDLSRTLAGVRCRANVYQSVRGVCLAIRLLSSFQSTLHDCNLHPDLRRFTEARTGLVIVSGATGSGKSTTLAALIEEINLAQRKHVIMLESPIEYFFSNRRSYIRQREIPTHSPSFEQAILDSMRENPDVLVIGEVREAEVMRLTLNAAETGHLVLATMHSATCAEALARMCSAFPPESQASVRGQLADCLVGVICQRLVHPARAEVRVPQCEVLVASSAVRVHVRTGQFSQLVSAIQTGGEEGMWSFERYQRWIDQKRDWVLPSQARPLAPEPASVPSGAGSGPARAEAPALAPARAARPSGATAARIVSPARTVPPEPASGRIEITPPADEDLEQLARRISGDDENEGV